MKRPDAAQLEALARRLLTHEARAGGNAEGTAAAGERVHQKIFARLASLFGATGAGALYMRAAKLAAPEFPCLRKVDIDPTTSQSAVTQIAACLRSESPAAVAEASVAFCTTLFSLLVTLIGEPLTFQVLRRAWPDFEPTTPNEAPER